MEDTGRDMDSGISTRDEVQQEPISLPGSDQTRSVQNISASGDDVNTESPASCIVQPSSVDLPNVSAARQQQSLSDILSGYEQATASPASSRTTSASSTSDPGAGTGASRSKTLVGGLLASSNTMKAFRSPLAKVDNVSSASSMTAETPTKPARHDNKDTPVRPVSFPKRKAPSASAPNAILNKPFRSPLVSRPSPSSSSAGTAVDTSCGPQLTSFQLSSQLPALERRSATIKNARRLLLAQTAELGNADNTDRIRELSAKWLDAGREAAEMLWELTKDRCDAGNTNDDNASFGFGSSSKSRNDWGWGGLNDSIRDEIAEKERRMRQKLHSMSDEDREDFFKQAENEEDRDPLPDADSEAFSSRSVSRSASAYTSSSRSSSFGQTRDDVGTSGPASPVKKRKAPSSKAKQGRSKLSKIANQEDMGTGENLEDDEDQAECTSAEDEGSDKEEEENPSGRGMAKMLIQCGIDLKILGWDASKEEWDVITTGTP